MKNDLSKCMNGIDAFCQLLTNLRTDPQTNEPIFNAFLETNPHELVSFLVQTVQIDLNSDNPVQTHTFALQSLVYLGVLSRSHSAVFTTFPPEFISFIQQTLLFVLSRDGLSKILYNNAIYVLVRLANRNKVIAETILQNLCTLISESPKPQLVKLLSYLMNLPAFVPNEKIIEIIQILFNTHQCLLEACELMFVCMKKVAGDIYPIQLLIDFYQSLDEPSLIRALSDFDLNSRYKLKSLEPVAEQLITFFAFCVTNSDNQQVRKLSISNICNIVVMFPNFFQDEAIDPILVLFASVMNEIDDSFDPSQPENDLTARARATESMLYIVRILPNFADKGLSFFQMLLSDSNMQYVAFAFGEMIFPLDTNTSLLASNAVDIFQAGITNQIPCVRYAAWSAFTTYIDHYPGVEPEFFSLFTTVYPAEQIDAIQTAALDTASILISNCDEKHLALAMPLFGTLNFDRHPIKSCDIMSRAISVFPELIEQNGANFCQWIADIISNPGIHGPELYGTAITALAHIAQHLPSELAMQLIGAVIQFFLHDPEEFDVAFVVKIITFVPVVEKYYDELYNKLFGAVSKEPRTFMIDNSADDHETPSYLAIIDGIEMGVDESDVDSIMTAMGGLQYLVRCRPIEDPDRISALFLLLSQHLQYTSIQPLIGADARLFSAIMQTATVSPELSPAVESFLSTYIHCVTCYLPYYQDTIMLNMRLAIAHILPFLSKINPVAIMKTVFAIMLSLCQRDVEDEVYDALNQYSLFITTLFPLCPQEAAAFVNETLAAQAPLTPDLPSYFQHIWMEFTITAAPPDAAAQVFLSLSAVNHREAALISGKLPLEAVAQNIDYVNQRFPDSLPIALLTVIMYRQHLDVTPFVQVLFQPHGEHFNAGVNPVIYIDTREALKLGLPDLLFDQSFIAIPNIVQQLAAFILFLYTSENALTPELGQFCVAHMAEIEQAANDPHTAHQLQLLKQLIANALS